MIIAAFALSAEPNPPNWPSSVQIFAPGDDAKAQTAVNAAFAENGGHQPANHGQFSSKRFAFLFKPGSYNVEVPVGFYTQVLGLGVSPDDTVFTSPKGVYSQEGDFEHEGGALCSFWRSAENFRTEASYTWTTGSGMIWAVSQAAPLRRVHVTGELILFEWEPGSGDPAGYASGGYLSNSKIDGKAPLGSQQQWFTRNSEVTQMDDGVWNTVFVGTSGAPASHCGVAPPGPHASVSGAPSGA